MTIKFADQRIHEARQRLTALDRALADPRRQSRRVAKSPDTRVALLAMREQSADWARSASSELVALIGLSGMAPEHMGLA
jgi:hypothetical protein